MTYRDFDAMLREKFNGRPNFTVGSQHFEARAKLPWKKFSHLILSMQGEDVQSSADAIGKTEEFFNLILLPNDRKRFSDLINHDGDEDEDDDHVVAPQQIKDILDWLLEYYTGKDETNDELSSDLPPATGQSVNGRSEVQTVNLNPSV